MLVYTFYTAQLCRLQFSVCCKFMACASECPLTKQLDDDTIIQASELMNNREERERFLRAQQNADKYGIAYASVCSRHMLVHALYHRAWTLVKARAYLKHTASCASSRV